MLLQKKNIGLTLVSLYTACGGLLCLGVATFLLFVSGVLYGQDTARPVAIVGGIVLILGITAAVSLYGLVQRRHWGRATTMWLNGIGILIGLLTFLPILPSMGMSSSAKVAQVIVITLSVMCIQYLARTEVSEQFKA